jgi:hypothetical protein
MIISSGGQCAKFVYLIVLGQDVGLPLESRVASLIIGRVERNLAPATTVRHVVLPKS